MPVLAKVALGTAYFSAVILTWKRSIRMCFGKVALSGAKFRDMEVYLIGAKSECASVSENEWLALR